MVADAVLRQFLLNRVDAEERQRIESLFITDAAFGERLLAVEKDLIDDYFEGSLDSVEQDSFRRQYAGTVKQRQKLDVSKSVKEWADSQLQSAPRLRKWNRRLILPIAAALLVGTVLSVIWIRSSLERRRDVGGEQELARLNSRAALVETPAGMQSLTLSSISTRTNEPGSEVDTGAAQLIELRLLWIQKEHYPAYRAVLKRVGGTEAFTIHSIHADSANQNVIRVRIPAHMLTRGQFRILLAAEAGNGPSDEYSFSVSR